jgi:membrane fusion protein, heavy metal efflux system
VEFKTLIMNKKNLVAVLICFSILACRHNHDHGHDHGHDDVKLNIIAYSDVFEIFAEADPFVAGKTSNILAHFTHLDDFKPLAEGKVTLSLVIGNRGIRQSIDAPEKPGIYRLALQPEITGTGRLIFEIETIDRVHTIQVEDSTVYDDEHDAIHGADALQKEHPAAVTFSKEQSWVISFATSWVQKQPMGTVIKTVGEIIPEHNDEILLTAQANGIINLTNNRLLEGVELSAGEILLNISGAGLADGNAIQRFHEARNNYERARADYERISKLAEDKIVSERELLQARNEAENSRIVFENTSRNFSESGQILRSPVMGYLKQLFVKNGQFVESGQAVATVFQNRNMMIRSEVQQRYAGLLSQLYTAHIISAEGNSYTLDHLGGEILPFARSVNARNHLLSVYLKINNTENQWIPGTLVDVYLKTRALEPVVVVPVDALIEEQGYFFVFVQIHPESFEKREVRIGISDGIYTEIKSGLSENERIISKGAIMVKISAASGDIDPHSGHVH